MLDTVVISGDEVCCSVVFALWLVCLYYVVQVADGIFY